MEDSKTIASRMSPAVSEWRCVCCFALLKLMCLKGLVKTFPTLSDLINYCRATPDTLSGMQLKIPIEQGSPDEMEMAGDEIVADEDLEADCTTAFLLQDALQATDSR